MKLHQQIRNKRTQSEYVAARSFVDYDQNGFPQTVWEFFQNGECKFASAIPVEFYNQYEVIV